MLLLLVIQQYWYNSEAKFKSVLYYVANDLSWWWVRWYAIKAQIETGLLFNIYIKIQLAVFNKLCTLNLLNICNPGLDSFSS